MNFCSNLSAPVTETTQINQDWILLIVPTMLIYFGKKRPNLGLHQGADKERMHELDTQIKRQFELLLHKYKFVSLQT